MKEELRSSLRLVNNRWVMLLLRLALGGLFIASSLAKLEHPCQFTDSVLSYHMLPQALARPFATGLPFLELFIGLSFVLGMLVLFSSALTVPLSLSLIIANVNAMVRHVGGINCPCLGSLVTMTHSSALAIDIATTSAAIVLLAWHRQAELPGFGRLLECDRLVLVLNQGRRTILKLALIAMCMVGAIAFVGAQKSLVAERIDDALNEDGIVLVFRYEGDGQAVLDDLVTLYNIQSRFGAAVYTDRCRTGQDPWADRRFPIEKHMPTLFIIMGEDTGRFSIRQRLEGTLNYDSVEAAIIGVLGDRGD